MAFDGIVTKSVVDEAKELLIGGRIDKVYQQERDEILLLIHSNKKNYKLLLSSSSNNARIYITEHSKKNPQTPPVFCMVLRKYLIGGKILDIKQHLMDRVVLIDISFLDDFGELSKKTLVIEIMGKHSNIILIDKETTRIIDSIKKVTISMSRVRQILPGLDYKFPPEGKKMNPLTILKSKFFKALEDEKPNTKIFKFFYFNYIGLSPLISREICFKANIDGDIPINKLNYIQKEDLFDTFQNMIDKISKKDYSPQYILDESDNIIAFHSLDLNQFGVYKKHKFDSVSGLLDKLYTRKDTSDRINQKSQAIRKSLTTKLDRNLNKLSKQKSKLLESRDRGKYKIYADLISANSHNIKRGAKSVELQNFYDENMKEIKIPLNHKISAIENAQKYYKKYSKLKTAENLLKKQIPQTKNEIYYLENVLNSIDNAVEVDELDEIKEELISEGYIRGKKDKKNKKKKQKLSKPHHYISKDALHIYVGKNNRQNDKLTLKFANKDDIWLHVKDMPGSHVIIRNDKDEIPETTLEQAAILAAFYSKAKYSNNVSVDFTEKKNVRKTKNAKPGMVIYDNFKTINISPKKELVEKIEKVED